MLSDRIPTNWVREPHTCQGALHPMLSSLSANLLIPWVGAATHRPRSPVPYHGTCNSI